MAIDKFRFGVGNENGLLSSVWIAFANRNDVYIGLRSMAQSLKLSIHGNEGSRVCQIALTNKYWEEMGALATPPMANRSLQRWKRADPPKSGATEIVTIWFPRDHQSQRTEQPPKKRGFFLLERKRCSGTTLPVRGGGSDGRACRAIDTTIMTTIVMSLCLSVLAGLRC